MDPKWISPLEQKLLNYLKTHDAIAKQERLEELLAMLVDVLSAHAEYITQDHIAK